MGVLKTALEGGDRGETAPRIWANDDGLTADRIGAHLKPRQSRLTGAARGLGPAKSLCPEPGPTAACRNVCSLRFASRVWDSGTLSLCSAPLANPRGGLVALPSWLPPLAGPPKNAVTRPGEAASLPRLGAPSPKRRRNHDERT